MLIRARLTKDLKKKGLLRMKRAPKAQEQGLFLFIGWIVFLGIREEIVEGREER
jgi:hypothetical protein